MFQEDLECEGTSKGTGSNFILQPSMTFTLGLSFILSSVTLTLPHQPQTDGFLAYLKTIDISRNKSTEVLTLTLVF